MFLHSIVICYYLCALMRIILNVVISFHIIDMQLLALIAQKCSTYGERNEQVIIVIIITTMVSPISSISHIEGKNISWSVCSVLVSPSPDWCHAPLYCLPTRTSSSCTDPPSAWCQSGPRHRCKPLFIQ